jgi:cytochrome c-type biogenesis protein CcmH/NrfG
MRIGKMELKASRGNEVLDVFREVVRLDGKNSDANNNAAYLLVRTDNCDADDLKEAEKFATNARKLDPKNPEYLDTLAEVVFKQGNTKMAQSLIEEALKLSPEKDALKNQLRRFKGETSLQSE